MDIKLAGYNVDSSVIDKAKHGISELEAFLESIEDYGGLTDTDLNDLREILKLMPKQSQMTPESISAAYARISRDPRPVNELRDNALEFVEEARKSNENIIHGMSHHNPAEHAVFNFDVMDISRLAIEELEKHRVGSVYTEKSQRYIKMDGDYYTPQSLAGKGLQVYSDAVQHMNNLYLEMVPVLYNYQRQKNLDVAAKADEKEKKGVPDEKNAERNKLMSSATEDARFILPLATYGQLGATFNARSLEYIIRTMKFDDREEIREMGKQFFDLTKEVAPSLIVLSDAELFAQRFKGQKLDEEFLKNGKAQKKQATDEIISSVLKTIVKHKNDKQQIPDFLKIRDGYDPKEPVNLLDYDSEGDTKVLAGLIFSSSTLDPINSMNLASLLTRNNSKSNTSDAKEYLKKIFVDLSRNDFMPREFELTDLTYELIISACGFGQLKRHRVMTLIPQQYDPSLGITIPNSIKESGYQQKFYEAIQKSNEAFNYFKEHDPPFAEYVLSNAHKRRAIVKTNLRELYNISRLREDNHAQWEIRQLAIQMSEMAKEKLPLTAALLSGKDKFSETMQKFYNN